MDSYSDEDWREGVTMDDDEILGILKAERMQSIGFEDNGDIETQREQALEYIKGEMNDVPSPSNRSSVVSSDVDDAIETVMPDLMEIFTGGENIASFKPQNADDEEQVKLETEVIHEVVFDQNPGFALVETCVRSSLEIKTGIFKPYWKNDSKNESFEGKTGGELEKAAQSGQIIEVAEAGQSEIDGQPLYNFTIETDLGKVCIDAVDPQNFGVSPDTVMLETSPYMIERSYPRAFELVDEGFDEESVSMLAPRTNTDREEAQHARDTVGENADGETIYDDLRRTVEVHLHTIRIDLDGDGKSEIWCFTTDADESIILDAYRKNWCGYAAGTPFRRAHRFYGRSLADKLIEIQKIKTSLIRMLLDNGYFALNQRMEVSEQDASKHTISDLLRNEPGYPIRSKTGKAVNAVRSGGLDFDVVGSLEYVSTVGEQRSGVVRNAQGLNPDTLHDTANGAFMLMTAAQRRVRMIARVLAETMLHDLFIGVHRELKENASRDLHMKISGEWMDVDPTSWGNRDAMTIEVGVGSGGREQEVAAIMQVIGLQKEALEGQAAGLIKTPMVTEQNLYASAERLVDRLGLKAPERYFTNPQKAAEQMPQQDGPSPEEQAAMAELQMEQQKAQAQIQLEQQKAQASAQLEREKAAAMLQAKREEAELDMQLARDKAAAEQQLAREKMAAEHELAREKMALEAQLSAYKAQHEVSLSDNRPGGRLDQ